MQNRSARNRYAQYKGLYWIGEWLYITECLGYCMSTGVQQNVSEFKCVSTNVISVQKCGTSSEILFSPAFSCHEPVLLYLCHLLLSPYFHISLYLLNIVLISSFSISFVMYEYHLLTRC
jgi:hypothetical protein